MCGIAGVVSSTPFSHEQVAAVAKMTKVIQHRGPDGVGFWSNTEHGVGFGHRRLSIVDLSESGAQPMSSSDGRYILTFNGEIYNHKELRSKLDEVESIPWRGTSDTEVMIEAIRIWGLDKTLEKVNGMFALALYDQKIRQVTLARDYFGEKPLYFSRPNAQTLIFGSEMRAIEAYPTFKGTLNYEAVSNLVQYSCIPSPSSIYSNVYKLPPGTRLTFELPNLAKLPVTRNILDHSTQYWSVIGEYAAARDDVTSIDSTDIEERLEAELKHSIGLRLQADVPVGVFLSGGIDSSIVSALAQSVSSVPIKTFTIGVDGDSTLNEAEDAANVAAHLGTDHTELYLSSSDMIDSVLRLPEIYDEPFADYSQIPTAAVSSLASDKVKVVLSGDAGDETFGGYNRHVWAHESWPKLRKIPAPLRTILGKVLQLPKEDRWDAIYGLVQSKLPRSLQMKSPGQKIHKFARTLGAGSERNIYDSLITKSNDDSVLKNGFVEYFNENSRYENVADCPSFADQMMIWDMIGYLSEDILTKVDRASMHVGLEVRVPFLDINVVRTAMRIPTAKKIVQSNGKQIIRNVLYKYVPRELIERPKAGFAIPIDQWIRTDPKLKDWTNELLSTRMLKEDPFLDAAQVRKIWEQHQANTHVHTFTLWNILMYMAWKNAVPGRSAG